MANGSVYRVALVLVALGATCSAALGGASLNIDAPTLNALLPVAVPKQVEVQLATGTRLAVQLDDLQVLGFDPAGGDDSGGHILTSLRVRIPQLGLDMQLEPRLALRVSGAADQPMIELRFASAEVRLPLVKLDIATLVPPMKYPAAGVFQLEGTPMFGRVTGVTIGAKSVRVEFDLERRGVPG